VKRKLAAIFAADVVGYSHRIGLPCGTRRSASALWEVNLICIIVQRPEEENHP
jgi:hypothetical protein